MTTIEDIRRVRAEARRARLRSHLHGLAFAAVWVSPWVARLAWEWWRGGVR